MAPGCDGTPRPCLVSLQELFRLSLFLKSCKLPPPFPGLHDATGGGACSAVRMPMLKISLSDPSCRG